MPKPLTPDIGKLDKLVAIQQVVGGVTNALGSLCEGEDLRDLVVAESRRRPTGGIR